MTRKVDPVVEIIAAECEQMVAPNNKWPYGSEYWKRTNAIYNARRIARALSRAGWLKEGRQ